MTSSPLPLRIQTMHKAFGRTPGKTCGDCRHLRRYKQSASWTKCDLTRQTGGRATDWSVRWPACGKFVLAAARER